MSKSNEYVRFEEFEHAGLAVALSVVGHDFSPRYADCAPHGVIVCAEPHRGLSDMDGGGRRVLADDVALAVLLAAPLTASGLVLLEAHARAEYGATVVLPLFIDEADASARTGISLSAESGDGVLAGVIFDRPDGLDYQDDEADGDESGHGSPESWARGELLAEVARYRSYLRGEIVMASVYAPDGESSLWTDMTDDDVDELRENAMRAAEQYAPEAATSAAAAAKQRSQWVAEDQARRRLA